MSYPTHREESYHLSRDKIAKTAEDYGRIPDVGFNSEVQRSTVSTFPHRVALCLKQ